MSSHKQSFNGYKIAHIRGQEKKLGSYEDFGATLNERLTGGILIGGDNQSTKIERRNKPSNNFFGIDRSSVFTVIDRYNMER